MRVGIFIGLLLASLCSSAQTFVKAQIITIKHDTLNGEAQVNEKKPMQKFEKVIFKDQNGVQKNYKPEKLLEYTLAGERFVALDSDGYPRFYKVLSTGAINFYELIVEMQVGNKIVPTTEYYLSYPNKKLVAVKTKKFKKQLTDWLSDNTALAEKYNKEEFDLTLATEIITEYNRSKATH